MRLNELKPGETAQVTTVGGKGALRQHFLDMGLIPGAVVTTVKSSVFQKYRPRDTAVKASI